MLERGYSRDFAEQIFADSGLRRVRLPRATQRVSHSLVYASAWLKCHEPTVFACALLNSQPMGFYSPPNWFRTRSATASASCLSM
jgi:error-prone DNA polymerase